MGLSFALGLGFKQIFLYLQPVKKIFPSILLAFALSVYGQALTSVAVLPSDGVAPGIGNDELEALTDKMRMVALKVLPTKNFVLLKQDVVVKRLGGAENYIKVCTESSCIVDLGKKAQVDYVSQASVSKLGDKIRLKVELYDVRTEGLIGICDGEAENIRGLLDIVEKQVSDEVFSKIPRALGSSKASPLVAGGISGVEKTADYELSGGKRYLVNLSTEPPGAILSFDGVPSAGCPRTPCKVELSEGNVRIIAALEQHEVVDTTVSVSRNNQSIAIMLKSNFGILDIRPAYIDGVGEYDDWNLSINGKAYHSFENRFSPGNYNVKLSHRCYEVVSFMAGISKGSREVFDMAGNIKLKKGGLDLSAERNGEPVVEPVFVNGKQVGDTPFSDAVPLCSEIEIGEGRETVAVVLKHNERVKYTHKSDLYEPVQYTSVVKKKKSSKASLWIGLGLEVLGAFIIYAGYSEHQNMLNEYDTYSVRGQSQNTYDNAWESMESKVSSRNALYTVGGILLASGIGVHILF